MQLSRQGCRLILHSVRAAVAEGCRRCCLDNAESAAHLIITVQFSPLAHRASLVSSRQLGGGPKPCNGPCSAHSATGCAAAQSPTRSRRHAARSIGRGASEWPTAAPAPHTRKRTTAKSRLRTAPLLDRRAYARRGYEELNQPRVDSLRLSTTLGISSCLAFTHDGSATPEIQQLKQATPDKSQSR